MKCHILWRLFYFTNASKRQFYYVIDGKTSFLEVFPPLKVLVSFLLPIEFLDILRA